MVFNWLGHLCLRLNPRSTMSRGLTGQWMCVAFEIYALGTIAGYWFYVYEAVSHETSMGIFVSFAVYYYLYQALVILYCAVWFAADRRASQYHNRNPPSTKVLRSKYLSGSFPSVDGDDDNEDSKQRTASWALSMYMSHFRRCHLACMGILSALAVVNIAVGIFFMAYAHKWEAYAICSALVCYPAILVLPMMCFCLYYTLYSRPAIAVEYRSEEN